jgi:DNA polymerase III subunit epsilon
LAIRAKVLEAIVPCPHCRQRNRVIETPSQGKHKCGKCGNQVIAPFKYVVFDCETTGLPSSKSAPHLVQLAWSLNDAEGNNLEERNYIVAPDGFSIPLSSTRIHGITDEQARKIGAPLGHVLEAFLQAADLGDTRLVAHNINFDAGIIETEVEALNINSKFSLRPRFCSMRSATNVCKIPKRGSSSSYKWPSLRELHLHLFGSSFSGAHDAIKDVQATTRCFFELRRRGLVQYS